MKNNKGISLISLAVIVFIMLLLSSITIVSSRDAYSVIKTQNFVSKMKIIQAKVDEVSENESYSRPENLKMKPTNSHYSKFEEIINNLKEKGILSESDDITNYYCFEPGNLQSELGIKDVNLTVIINFDTRNIIAEKGITIDGKTYYRQYDIDSGEKLIN